ncbi:histone H4-K16 acetylation [Homalodisca vitripennis]|nr:histone H4-K16 acetylation [Homalodisca vitripennis]
MTSSNVIGSERRVYLFPGAPAGGDDRGDQRHSGDENHTDTSPYMVVSGTSHPSPIPSPSPSPHCSKERGDGVRRKRENSYDIDNIVIPYSVAASTRLEKLQYKEILTPKWRVLPVDPLVKIDAKNNGLIRRNSQEEDSEDLAEDVLVSRHERCEQEEKKKFSTYLKLPNSMARARSHRRADSRAESSGGNTPDPMSPAAPDCAGSPMTSPPATPQPADADCNVRRRTASQSIGSRCVSPTDTLHDEVAPYDLRTFPLTDEIYEKMLRLMPPGHPFKAYSSSHLNSSRDSELPPRIRIKDEIPSGHVTKLNKYWLGTGPPPDLTSGSAPYNPILSGGIRRRKKHCGSNLVQDEYGRSGWMPLFGQTRRTSPADGTHGDPIESQHNQDNYLPKVVELASHGETGRAENSQKHSKLLPNVSPNSSRSLVKVNHLTSTNQSNQAENQYSDGMTPPPTDKSGRGGKRFQTKICSVSQQVVIILCRDADSKLSRVEDVQNDILTLFNTPDYRSSLVYPATIQLVDEESESRPLTPLSDTTESADTYVEEDPNDPEWTVDESSVERLPFKR